MKTPLMKIWPILPTWLTKLNRQTLTDDLTAGVVVAILVIPQSLAYALLAGLPPQAGLYVSIFPVIAYALVGSSMTQAVGPVAVTAIMTFAVLSPLALAGSAEYIALAAGLAFCSGVIVLLFGTLRLGFLSQLLSRPVVSGFVTGSALLIVISQLKFVLGVQLIGNQSTAWELLTALWGSFRQLNLVTLLIGGATFLLLLGARYGLTSLAMGLGATKTGAQFLARIMPLIALVVGTSLVIGLNLDRAYQVAVVGKVPEGLTSFIPFVPSLDTIRLLAMPALVIAFIGMVQNITMAQALAIKRHERVNPNRELVGLGSANVVAAFYGGMPVGGGLSRSAINTAAGARTPLASIVAALVLLVVVLIGTQWFARLPLTVLAASIIIAAIGMIDMKALLQAWSYDRADACALLGTTAGVLILGLEWGIALGIGLSLATLLLRASNPHIAVIGRIAGTEHFRNVERHGVDTIAGAMFLRIDESLFFGNLSAVETRLSAELTLAPATKDVVLIMSAVNRIDTTAMEVLTDINRDLADRQIKLHLAEIKGPVQDRLINSPLWKSLSGQVFLSVNSAFEALLKK
jgi:sulfate permease, SulP family